MGTARAGWLFAAACIALGAAGAAHAVNWVTISKTAEYEASIDIDSFARPGATPSFWLLVKFPNGKRDKLFSQPYYAVRSRFEVNCRDQLMRFVGIARLAQDGVTPLPTPRVSTAPGAYMPGTPAGSGAQFTCLLTEFRLPTVDLSLGGGGTPEKELTSKDGTTTITFPPFSYRNGRLLSRVKLVSSGTEFTPTGKEYKTAIDYLLTDCAQGTHHVVARNRFDESGKTVSAEISTEDQQQQFDDPALKDYLLSVCKTVDAQGPGGSGPAGAVSSVGSGFAVTKDGYVVTNQHVIEGCTAIQVRLPQSGAQLPATMRWSDKKNDIAVLKVEHAFGAVAELRQRPLTAGDQVMAYGFPFNGLLATEGVFSAGMVSATSGMRNDTTRLQISNPVQPGNSGGPLLDESGAVAGVVVSKLDALKMLIVTGDIPQNINFAVKGEVVRLLLDTFGVGYVPAKSARRLEPREIADRAKSFTLLVTCHSGEAAPEGAPAQAVRPKTAVASAAPVAAAATSAAEGMPTRGTKWRYSYRDEQYGGAERNFTVEILGVESSQVRERFIVEGGATSQGVVEGDQLRFMARSISSTASVVELAPYAPALHKRVALVPTGYPAVPGASWKVGNASYTEDSVTVPAGTFAALRVEITGTAEAFGLATTTYAQPARFVYTAWYAPEIKRYVKVRHQTWSRVGTSVGDEIVQLTAYQPRK